MKVNSKAAPLVSILTMNYNYANFIGETIESIITQDYRDIQYIIVDDGSTDNSRAVIRSFKDPRIEFYPLLKNVGATAAFAEGYSKVRGEFVCCIDADDVIAREKTRRQVERFQQAPGLDIVGTYVKVIDRDGNSASTPHLGETWVNQPRDLNDASNWLSQNYLAHSSVMIRRGAHDAIGVLDPDMSAAPDYDHFLRFFARGYKFEVMKDVLLKYRVHSNNNTHKAPEKTFIEMLYSFWRYLGPKLIERRRFSEIAERLHLAATSEHFSRLSFDARMRLWTLIASSPDRVNSFAEFMKAWEQASPHVGMMLESVLEYSPTAIEYRRMVANVGDVLEGLEWWRRQTESHARVVEMYRKKLEGQ